MAKEFEVRLVRDSDRESVCEFLTSNFPRETRDSAGSWLHSQFQNGQFQADWLFAASWKSKVYAAVYLHRDQAAGATVLGYRTADPRAETALWAHLRELLPREGVNVVQVISTAEKAKNYSGLAANGFASPCQLIEYTLTFSGEKKRPEMNGIRLEAFEPDQLSSFAELLVRTYVDSLDSPELNDCRTPAQAMAGHLEHARGESPFLFRAWFGDTAIGVLFLNPAPTGKNWELTYLGIVPEHRNRGHGKTLVSLALGMAATADAPGMILTLDTRNGPARRLYELMGFRSCGSYDVHLLLFKG